MMPDWNLIRALISQAPLNELYQVKDIIEKEIQWTRDNLVKQQQAEQKINNIEQYNENTKRAIPRYAQAGIGPEVGRIRGADPVDGSYSNETTDQYEPDQYKKMRDDAGQTPLHVAESGATSSHVPLRYDLIPRSLLERAAERYTMGMQRHGERNYQQGLGDRGNIIVRINHIYEHLNKLFHPDYRNADSPESEEGIEIKSIRDNLGAILWGLGFISEVAEHNNGKQILIELRAEGRLKTHSD